MPQRLKLTVTDKKLERKGDTWHFTVAAKPFTGNPIKFHIECPNHELNDERIKQINAQFKTSLQYIKHVGGWPDREHENPEDMKAELNKWSSTNLGYAVKVQDDPLPEFVPFAV